MTRETNFLKFWRKVDRLLLQHNESVATFGDIRSHFRGVEVSPAEAALEIVRVRIRERLA